MTTLCKTITLLLCVALFSLPLAAQNNPDCSFTYRFTGDGTQTAVSNLSGSTPCVNWRVTLSTDAAIGGTLSSTVTFQTSPDNATWTPIPNTVCSATVQPPCVLQGANPIVGTQGMLYVAAYGAYVQVVISASSGTGNGVVRGYGSKGASASALPGGGGGGSGTVTQVNTTGPITGGPITGSGTIALDTTKVAQKFFGTSAPGSVTGNLPGDLFTDTTAHNEYVCNAPAGTAAPACTSVTAAGWLLVNGAGGGGSLTFGSLAARPATGTAGQQYIATDTLVDSYVWDTAWRAFISGQIVNPPKIADLTTALLGTNATRTVWADQGGAGGGLLLEGTNSNPGSDSGVGQFATLPATPWTLTSRFRLTATPVGGDNLWGGIALYDSNSGKLEIIGIYQQVVRVGYWNSITSFNATVYESSNISASVVPSSIPSAVGRGSSFIFRVTQDGTNRIISRSTDGLNWVLIDSRSQTNFLTPTHYGVLIFPYGGPMQMSVIDLTMQ